MGFFIISMDNPDQLGNSNFLPPHLKNDKLQSIIAFLQFIVNNPGYKPSDWAYVKSSGPSAMSDRRLPLIHVTLALGSSVFATSAHQDHQRARNMNKSLNFLP